MERAQVTVKAGRFPYSSVYCFSLVEDQHRVLQCSGYFRCSLRNRLECPRSSAGSWGLQLPRPPIPMPGAMRMGRKHQCNYWGKKKQRRKSFFILGWFFFEISRVNTVKVLAGALAIKNLIKTES